MYTRVDVGGKIEHHEGYSYENSDGDLEYVTTPDEGGIVDLIIDDGKVLIYRNDIPKLIKALQATYGGDK